MNLLLILFAIIFLFLGHAIKVKRWEQFIEIYEPPPKRRLYLSLGVGYLVNFLIPFHLGDLIRAFVAGKKLKTGNGFAIATVIVDRYLDFLIVGLLFITFIFAGYDTIEIRKTTQFYLSITIILIVLSALAIAFTEYLKKVAKSFCSIFNSKIELKLLFFCWAIISTFKDITKINKTKLLIYTTLMWVFYLFSYFLFAKFWTHLYKENTMFIDIFNQLFSVSNIDFSTLKGLEFKLSFLRSKILMQILFYLIPVTGLILVSKLPSYLVKVISKNENIQDKNYLKLLPYENEIDKLSFLETYFSSKNKDYIGKFIEINRDISILKDYSAGSNATTMLCMDKKVTFFRKFTFGNDALKLQNQVEWIKNNSMKLPLPKIINNVYLDELCSYDMEYKSSIVGMFNYIHSNTIEKTWGLMLDILKNLNDSLYINLIKSDKETITKYVEQKITKNLNLIKKSHIIKPLLNYDFIYINGVKYKNIKLLEKYLTVNFLLEIFSKDDYSEIHGDLTIENIICDYNIDPKNNYYLIDPNDGNIHNSPFLDYGKLFQSLHGGYEFLIMTQKISIRENKIDFLFTKSQTYFELFNLLCQYFKDRFGEEGLRSIFFHEIVHWLRLIPYKLEKNGERSLIFYSGFIIVMNEVINKYETGISGTKNHIS